MSDRLEVSSPPGAPGSPPGPHFRYEQGPDLFLGRRGDGPLDVVWDTNVLIDYFQHGRAIWEGRALPDAVIGEYGEELEALQLIIALWAVREIRFHVLLGSLTDAKRVLAQRHKANRTRALLEFAHALALDGWTDGKDVPQGTGKQLNLPGLRDPAVERAIAALPPGYDRSLVVDALRLGVHVFMTRDKGVLKCRPLFKVLRLAILSPQDLLEELAAAGGLHCLLDKSLLTWPIPDLQRTSHLIQALPEHP